MCTKEQVIFQEKEQVRLKFNNQVRKRFFSKVKIPTNKEKCWIWIGAKNSGQYGYFSYKEQALRATRVSYEIHRNVILKPSQKILHTCDNPSCVNPAHLYIGTPAKNSQDMVDKNRSLFGERNPSAKLSWNSVTSIRNRYKSKTSSISELALEYNVSRSQIQRIINQTSWKPRSSNNGT